MKIIKSANSSAKADVNYTPERILLFGGPNSGKTRALLTTSFYFPDNTFHIIDPDDGVLRVVNELGGEDAFPNVELYVCLDYKDIKENIDSIKKKSNPGDWVGLEMLGRFWDYTQDAYSNMVFGDSVANHFVALRKELVKAEDESRAANFDGFTDWKLIKLMHNKEIMNYICLYTGLNIIATSSFRKFNEYLDKDLITEDKTIFKKAGVRPEGEKHNPHLFNTIIYMYRSVKNDYLMDSLREKGVGNDGNSRSLFEAANFTNKDFWDAYSKSAGFS